MAYITGTTQEERQYGSKKKVSFTATAGQTIFTPGFDYIPGSNVLEVYINGVKQAGSAYTESQNFITLTEGVQAGDIVEIVSDVVEHRLTGEVEWLRRNYGPYPSDPTQRPDGTAMVAGDEYFNATIGKKKYFNGSIWVLDSAVLNFIKPTIMGFDATGFSDGEVIYFKGRDVVGDGGGGMFRYSAFSVQAADGGLVFAPSSGGRLFREGWTVHGFTGPVRAEWFGIKGDNSTVNTAAISAAAAVSTEIVFGPGVFLTGEIDLRGKYITLTGAGQTHTTLKASGAFTDLINAFETSDVQVSPFVLRAMTIDGNNTTSNGVRLRWRHHAVLEDLIVRNCVNNILELDSWLVVHRNVRSTDCTNALWLLGANHNSLFERCSFIGASEYQIKIESNGTVPDGNHGLCFNACDVEFGSGGGIYIDATSVNFNSGYLGENISGPIFTVVGGVVSVNGGTLFFGHTTNSYGVAGTGGRVIFNGASLSNQSLNLDRLVSSNGVKASFINVDGNTAVGGDTALLGDALDYGPAAKVFAPRYGKNYTKVEYNNTISETTSGKSKTFTVASVTGSPSILTVNANLIDRDQWMDGEGAYLVVVYSSNAIFRARLAGGIVGTAPLKILGDLPSTGGVTKTYVKLDGTLDGAAYNILELYNDNAVSGTYITLHEVFLSDNAMLNKTGSSSFSKLHKC